ncbi:MAG: hypothetical protein KGH72_02115 [Candidatus Micrarchaeota archaeon]|nr:hypothetical protein [Candidatus Micrarchaeota archaeon]
MAKLAVREIREKLGDPRVAVVLNFDGLLFNTSSFHRHSFEVAVERVTGQRRSITDEERRTLAGLTDQQIAGYLLRNPSPRTSPPSVSRDLPKTNGHVDKTTQQLIEEREKALLERVGGVGFMQFVIPGVPPFMYQLKTLGRKAGIATSSPDSFVIKLLQETGFPGFGVRMTDVIPPSAIVGSTKLTQIELEMEGSDGAGPRNIHKPDPASVYLAAIAALDAEGKGHMPREIIYFGGKLIDAVTVHQEESVHGVIVSDNGVATQLRDAGIGNMTHVDSLIPLFRIE